MGGPPTIANAYGVAMPEELFRPKKLDRNVKEKLRCHHLTMTWNSNGVLESKRSV
jgi:hypothetical protein